jgi:hypothetical protein
MGVVLMPHTIYLSSKKVDWQVTRQERGTRLFESSATSLGCDLLVLFVLPDDKSLLYWDG